MNWYLTTIVYRIICGEGNHAAQFDEQLRLVYATSKEEAVAKAKAIGVSEQETFYNDKTQLVQWQFVNVSAVYCLDDCIDGAEVFSQIKEVSSADAYTNFVHQKASALQHQPILTC
jgi:hypothetical protein